MQFHLTNHRPKICLLCGSLFNNSNDFFEHIQYEHKPQGAMACRKYVMVLIIINIISN